MRIQRLQDMLLRILIEPPDGLRQLVPITEARNAGHAKLGQYDLVTHWDRPDRVALDRWIRRALEDAKHPEITDIDSYGGDNERFGRDGVRLTFTDGSHGHVRFLPAPDDASALIVRLYGSSPPGGDDAREDHDGTPAKTRDWEERWPTVLTAAPT